MKSIYLGGNRIFEVYDRETRELLQKHTQIEPVNQTKEEILSSPEAFRDTACIFSTWGMPAFSVQEIRTCLPALRAVFYGAGSVQHFARPFLDAGVRVFSAWAANAVPVAEYTLAQILLANKGFYLAARRNTSPAARAANAAYVAGMPGNYGATVGILGAGMIGKTLIRMLAAYRLRVLVYDPFLSEEAAAELGVRKTDLPTLFAASQVVSNHVANLPATRGMLNYDLFSLMKPNAVFLNTGRGAQVVEADLCRILRERQDMTAVLDVTDPEPPAADSPLYTLPNVFLTPHIAGSSGDEVARMGTYMAEEFLRMEIGEECLYEVSAAMLATMA